VLDIVVTRRFYRAADTALSEVFYRLGIGKLPEGGKLPLIYKNASVFAPEKSFSCTARLSGCDISSRYYNIETEKKTDGANLPESRGVRLRGTLSLPPGKYECKVYVDQVWSEYSF
jgi:hypothetical protein